jgi:hypothetical protein
MEAGLLDLMRQSVAIKAWSRDSTDGYGSPVYTGLATTYKARVVAEPHRLVRPDGHEAVSTHVAWVASTAIHGLKDQFTFDGSTYPIQKIFRPTDELGRIHHSKFYLGLA